MGKGKRLTQEQADCRINEVLVAKNFTLLEPYVHGTAMSKVNLHCNTCNYEWGTTYNSLVYGGSGCAVCGGSKRLTQEQADCRINEVLVAKSYTLLEPYVHGNVNSKVKLHCNTCNYEWDTPYNTLVNGGNGCAACSGKKRLTQEQADSRINEVLVAKGYTIIKSIVYKNKYSKMKLHCNTCNYEWDTTYNNLIITGSGCAVCGGSKQLTQEQADSRINEVLVAKNFTLLEPYVHGNVHSKVKLHCNTCNCEWDTTYHNLVIVGSGCAACSGKKRLTQEQADSRINEVLVAKGYTIIKPIVYENVWSKMKLHCNTCNYEWDTTYNNLVNAGNGCEVCGGQNQKLAYITLVLDNELPVGIKYGIETTLGKRAKQQNNRNIFDARRIKTFQFETVQDCKAAEKKCKKIFQAENEDNLGMKGIFNKRDFKDGCSETTTIQNMDRVIDIYKSFGGIEVLNSTDIVPAAIEVPKLPVLSKGTPFASIKGRTLSLV